MAEEQKTVPAKFVENCLFLCYTTKKNEYCPVGMGSQTEIREVQSVSGMDCRTAESMVTRFIDHSLSVNELEEFLDHIETCPSCYDELETYFIVHEAMQQLDEKEDGTVLDFKKLLEQEIRRSRRSIRQTRGIRFTVGLISMAAAVALCVFVIFVILGV